jgi:hypothetical protein
MANPHRGEMALVAGAQTYVLRLTTNASCEVEELASRLTGRVVSFDQIVRGVELGRISDIRLLLWASLRNGSPEVASDDRDGLRRVGAIVDEAGGLVGVLDQLMAFLKLNQDTTADQAGEGRPPDAPVAEDGTGARSTSMPESSGSPPNDSGRSRSVKSGES